MSGSPSPLNEKIIAVDHLKGSLWVIPEESLCRSYRLRVVDKAFYRSRGDLQVHPLTRCKPKPGERCFDLFDGDFTHEGDRCTFEVMIRRLGFQDPALTALAEIVHDIDLKGDRYGHKETEGLRALLSGVVTAYPDDSRRLEEGARLFENLYTYFQRQQVSMRS